MGMGAKIGLIVGGLAVLYGIGVAWEKATGQLDQQTIPAASPPNTQAPDTRTEVEKQIADQIAGKTTVPTPPADSDSNLSPAQRFMKQYKDDTDICRNYYELTLAEVSNSNSTDRINELVRTGLRYCQISVHKIMNYERPNDIPQFRFDLFKKNCGDFIGERATLMESVANVPPESRAETMKQAEAEVEDKSQQCAIVGGFIAATTD